MSNKGVLQQINENPISSEEMEEYLRAMEEDEGEPSFERGTFIAMEVFGRDVQKCMSANMRMTALAKLLEEESLPGWVRPKQSDGSYRVAPNLYVAAGQEPLVEDEKGWGFDKDSLLQHAFRLGKLES